ncbi:hypothetical protein [Streptomyces sp. NBC_01483]|uniref:hypothetical protein n=1 Tax=Streptomyces sp. NBC_01483 TaxID=2903883 RepID=UPI002E32BA06|nr:hypothetical protein [Streptomyces sp. NBC_01483]
MTRTPAADADAVIISEAAANYDVHISQAQIERWRGRTICLTAQWADPARTTRTSPQPWLREATQAWAVDDLPRRRGLNPTGTMQRRINAIARLSESLRTNRSDDGVPPRLLGRDDIIFFLTRMRFLQEKGEISPSRHVEDTRAVRRLLARMRTLELAQAGQVLHGLQDDFCLREEDIPDDPEDSEAGRDLPVEVMRQLCEH